METVEQLRGRIGTANDLLSVVKTMKGMAAVNIRQYERAVEALNVYAQTVEMAFHVLVRDRPQAIRSPLGEAGEKPVLAVVFGSDQGLAGPFNREIAAHTAAWFEEHGVGPGERAVMAIGVRAASELDGAGFECDAVSTLPGAAPALTGHVRNTLLRIERWREENRPGRVLLFHHRPRSGASYKPQTRPLIPLDLEWLRTLAEKPWPARGLPFYTLPWEDMFGALVREHLFTLVFRAYADSLASENASRLASMQNAETNIQEKIDQLQARFHQRRQASITEELLDVVAGFEVLKQ